MQYIYNDCALQSVKWAGVHLALRFKEYYNTEYDFRKISGKQTIHLFIYFFSFSSWQF